MNLKITNPLSFIFLFLVFSQKLNSQIINTIAGGAPILNGVPALSCPIAFPIGLSVDRNGNVFFVEYGQNIVRKIGVNGLITTKAGNGNEGYSGDGGNALLASFNFPEQTASDQLGNLYISDTYNNVIRKISTSGIITTYAGTGAYGFSGDGGPATQAQFYGISDFAVDPTGNIVVCDLDNKRIRKISNTGIVTTIAGNGGTGNTGDNGLAINAEIGYPNRLTIDNLGNIYFSNEESYVRKIDVNGIITTVAGNGNYGDGGDGGQALNAEFGEIASLMVHNNELYLLDFQFSKVRKINSSGIINTVIGGNGQGFSGDGGPAVNAQFNALFDMAIDQQGNMYLADAYNNRIRKVNLIGVVNTVAGTNPNNNVSSTSIQTPTPDNLMLDQGKALYYFEEGTCLFRKINFDDDKIINTAGTGIPGNTGNGTPANIAGIDFLSGITKDANGNIYLANDNKIRKINQNGIINHYAGNFYGSSPDGTHLDSLNFDFIWDIKTDNQNNLLVSEYGKLRKINLSTGIISTVAGNGSQGYSGDGSDALNAEIHAENIAIAKNGDIFICDGYRHNIRKIDHQTNIITTIAGNGNQGYTGDGGLSVNSQLNSPSEIALDTLGNLFIADTDNNAIRKINLQSGIISTIAGNGTAGFYGDGGPAAYAKLSGPTGLAVDPSGNNIYISDQKNSRIRCISNLAIPEICMVTVDSTSQHNIIYWDKSSYYNVDSFFIYRETNSNPSVYTKIGSVSNDSLSLYMDTARSVNVVNGNPNVTTYRYKLRYQDKIGNFSFNSNFHNSIYVNNTGSFFSWNNYEIQNNGNPASYYQLMRDNYANGNWEVVGTTAGNQTNLNDPNYSTFENTALWRVETVWNINCAPTLREANPNSIATQVVKSKSNIRNNRMVGLNNILKDEFIHVYPNPAKDFLKIDLTIFDLISNNLEIELINTLGQLISKQKITSKNTEINLDNITSGLYILKLNSNNKIKTIKFIVE